MPVANWQSISITDPATALLYDSVSDTVAYLGKASIAASTASAVWQVRKFTFGTDGDVTVGWADGDEEYNNIWDNRASLSYS